VKGDVAVDDHLPGSQPRPVCFFFEETKFIPNRAGLTAEEPRNKTEESKQKTEHPI
jgi:hypothetical protein